MGRGRHGEAGENQVGSQSVRQGGLVEELTKKGAANQPCRTIASPQTL